MTTTRVRRQTRSRGNGRMTRLSRPSLEPLERRVVLSPVSWINPNGGDWDTAANWSSDAVPGASDDVTISIAVSNPITHSSSQSDFVDSITSSDPIVLSGGSLSIANASTFSNTVTLSGGTLAGGPISMTNGATMVGTYNNGSGGTLSGVTFDGTLDLSTNDSANVTVTSGLTLNGTINLGNASGSTYGRLNFVGAQTLGGSGTVLFGGDSNNNDRITTAVSSGDSGKLTIGSGITLEGENGLIGNASLPLINQGTINDDVSGGAFNIYGTNWSNTGTLEASNGGSLSLNGTWANTGPITASGGTVYLNGTWTNTGPFTASAGTMDLAGAGTFGTGVSFGGSGVVYFEGTLNNAGFTLSLNDASLSYFLAGGAIDGGTVDLGNGASLVVAYPDGTLAGVAVDGTLDLATLGGAITVTGGLTLNGAIDLGSASGSTLGQLNFVGAQSLAGSGSVLFGAGNPYANNRITTAVSNGDSGTLTIGSGITLHGNTGLIGNASLPLINQGTIDDDVSGGSLAVYGTNWSSTGTLEASNGGSLSLDGTWANTGPITASGGTVYLNGTWTNTGPFTASAGTMDLAGAGTFGTGVSFGGSGVVYFEGTLNNAGFTLSLNDASLSYFLAGGAIDGGTVDLTNGASLVVAYPDGTLAGVAVDGTLDLATLGGAITVTGGLTLNGAIDLGSASGSTLGQLNFVGAQSLAGSGSVLFGAGNPYANNRITTAVSNGDSGTLTIGSGITLHGQTGLIGNSSLPLIDQGTVADDVSGGSLAVYGTNWSSTGTLEASNGGSLSLNGTWANTGPITASGGTVYLNGAWTNTGPLTASAGTMDLAGAGTFGAGVSFGGSGGVYFEGTLNNAGFTLSLNDASLSYFLAGGTIDGGTVDLGNGASLVVTYPGGTLAGVSVDGTLDLATLGGAVTVTGGLTLNGAIDLGSASGSTLGQLNFVGAQSLAGSGSVLFGAGNTYANNRITTAVSNGDSGTLTIGSGITLHGNTGLIGNASLPLINQGTIADDISGGSLAVYGTNWSSTGALEASNGGSVELYGALTNSGTIEANGGSVVGLNGSWANSGTITANAGGVSLSGTGTNAGAIQDANGGILTSSGGALTNTGIVEADGTSTVSLNNNSVTINSSGIMIAQPSATLGIAGSLFGNTTDKDLFQPNGTVDLDGSGSSTIPQFLEVMGDDLGNVPAGFLDNFVYGTLAVGSKDYVRLVDLQNNSGSSSPEALYVNTLIVPSGSTLDLNGLHLYYRAGEINGTITAGSATPLLGGGPLPLNSSAPGNLQVAGEVDDWTFFGRAGQSVDLFLHTGSGGAPAPIQPALNHGEITLLDPNGNQVAIASNSQSGADASILNEMLPADGTYQIEVQAASGSSASLGNYVVAEYDAGVYTSAIDLDQTVYGQLNSPYSQDQWTLSATADTQINFDLIASANPSLQFSLTGPDGFIGFSGLSTGSELVTLPTSGTYVLNASTSQAAAGGGAYAFRVYQTAPTDLALGTEYHGTLIGSGQPQLFVLNVPAASPMFAQIADADTSDHIELYAKFKAPPTREDYDYGANGVGSSQSLLIPSATAGTWYLLVYAESVASTPGYFTLQVNATPLVVNAVTPVQYGTNAVATFTLNGAGFTSATSVSLVGSDNTVYPASSVSFDTFTQLTATISLAGVPQGTYSVQVTTSDGSISTLPAAFTVTAAGQANFQTQLILPDGVGRHISSTFYVEYSNTGTVAMPAPLLLLESSLTDDLPLFTLDPSLVYSGSWTSAIPEGYSNTVEILASGKVPGVLGPGESVTVPVYYAGMELPWNFGESHFEFDLQVFNTTDVVPVDLDRLLSSSQPAGISNNAWESIYPTLLNEIDQFGTYNPPYPIPGFLDTDLWSSYVKFLDSEAVYLGQLGEDVTDVSQLWGFAVQQADNDLSPVGPYLASATDDSVATPGDLSLSFSRVYSTSVDGRVALGPLGVGWSTPWQTSASTASDGTVTIAEGDGTQRVFQPDSRTSGVFFSQTGDTGTLTADGNGGYLLTEADGSATDYNPNGTLNDIEDTNGNRITAGYTNGQLTSLTASSGQWIDIGYNAAGLISTITDSQSRVTTYAYESISQYHDVPPEPYLAAVTGFNGQTTSYSYEPTSNFAFFDEESLTSIAFPGGTHQYFTYNAYGWLASICNDDGAQPLSFAYALGQVSVTDGAGDTSNLYYNEEGMVVKSIDPLGNVSLITYDNKFNLTKVTNALGQSETYTYNAAGEATSSTDFLGNTTYFTYSGPFNQLASMTDANGNTTSYAYDSSGDLLSTTYANGTSESFTYDPEGNATSFLNANGQPTQYAYNAAGQITTETFSDGSQYAYTYDGQGNLVTATDATGTTTFTYDPTTELLTEVAYPNDMSLTFTYNAAGQRTSVVDQTGFTVNYDYDTIGRLSELADGSGNPIVTYTYDAAGRVSGKTNGNGTYTTYQYDADGNVLDLINYAPGGTVDSRFDYTYNSLGLETSEATLDGSWTYTYDVDGQLIHAVFASTNPNVPSQDLAYNYDAMGNRITTVINGVSTAYTTNNMNQYTSVGGVADTYDADGNLTSDGTNTYRYDSLNQLISVVGPSGITSYTYNALGQRVASTTNGQTTQYVIDPSGLGNVVSEYDGSGNLLAHYNYGFGLVSQVNTSENSYFYNFSAIGNTSELTNASGVVVNSYTYDPFGVPLGKTEAVANPFQYVGEYGVMNEGNGLEFMGVRSYEAAVGRFVQPDPIGIDGGINLYKYGENLPTRYIDPVGTCGVWFPIGLDPHVDPWEGQEPYHFADPFNPPPSPYCDDGGQCIPVLRPAPDPGPFLVPAPDPGPFLVPAPPIDPPFNPAPNNPDLIPPQYKYGPVPTPPPCLDCSGQQVYIQHSYDPNSLIGPAGFGSDGFIALGLEFPYRVNFENEPTATAPAQRVDITDQLDTNLDWTTFQLTQVGFGDTIIDIPPDSQHFQTTVPITENGQNFDVQIELGANTATGQVYAQFLSIDPNTQLPPDVLTGFLPPEDGTGRGMGFFSYIIQPKAGLPTGTQTRNVALISFDLQPSIATDQVNDDDPSQGVDPNKQDLNTIDSVPPTSSVGPLPRTETSSSFTVTWSGQDDPGGSGIAFYNIYDSEDGGPYSLWQSDTTDTSATFTGQPGHTYAFYSVATDNVGNVQPTPASAQQTVQVLQAPTTTTVTPGTASVGFGQSAPFTATVSSASGAPPDGSVQFIVNGAAYGSPVALSGSIAQLAITEPAGSYTIAAQYTGDADYAATLAAAESTASLTVSPVATATAVTPSAATVSFGQSATFAATVSSAAGAPPDGAVQFLVNGAAYGSPVALSSGTAQLAITEPAGSYAVAAQYMGDANYAATVAAAETMGTLTVNQPMAPATNLAISPNTGISAGLTDTGAVTFTGSLSAAGMTVDVFDTSTNTDLRNATVTGTSFSLALNLAEGSHVLRARASLDGTYADAFFTVLVDLTPPTSHVVNSLGSSQSSDTFTVSVAYSDPAGSGGAPASGVSSVDLYDSVNNGPFSLYQTQALTSPTTSGTVAFTFVGQDRNLYAFHSVAHDAAGNTENKSNGTSEATTSVPDLNPPVTHILATNPSYSWNPFPSSEFSGLTPSSYNNGVFTINWAGADPDANTGTPAGSIALVNIYVQVDGGAPVLIGQPTGGTPNGSGVYSGSITYSALADGLSHTYSFYSVGVDDEQLKQYAPQAGPAAPDVTFSNVTYTAALGIQNLVVEKNIAERSFIQYLDVDFNQSLATSPALKSLAAGLTGSSRNSFVELVWYGENLTSSSAPQGSVNLFNAGTTASLALTGNDLSINFGANGITSLLTETGVSGTGSPTSSFGDGWYALGIDPNGNPSKGQVFWVSFFRLLGDTNGDGVVTGPYTTAGTDAYTVYHAEGQSGSLLNADVNGDGAVNSKDLTETVGANGHAVGATPPGKFPQFQLFVGPAGRPGAVTTAVTQAQVQALLSEAIAAWQSAGLDPADVRRLESVQVQVGNLGTSILGLEAGDVITINQTAAGNNWYVNASAGSSRAFGLIGPAGEELAEPGSPAAGEVDLLTVLEHELGHVIGLSDNAQAGDLMDITIGTGVRRAPTAADLGPIAQPKSIAVTAPVPAVVSASDPQPVLVNGSVSVRTVTVDAALASISTAAAGDDEGQGLTASAGSPAWSVVRIAALAARPGRKDRSPQSALAYRHLPSSLFPQMIRRQYVAARASIRPTARERGNQ